MVFVIDLYLSLHCLQTFEMHKYGMLWEDFRVFGLISSEILPPSLRNVVCHAEEL